MKKKKKKKEEEAGIWKRERGRRCSDRKAPFCKRKEGILLYTSFTCRGGRRKKYLVVLRCCVEESNLFAEITCLLPTWRRKKFTNDLAAYALCAVQKV